MLNTIMFSSYNIVMLIFKCSSNENSIPPYSSSVVSSLCAKHQLIWMSYASKK